MQQTRVIPYAELKERLRKDAAAKRALMDREYYGYRAQRYQSYIADKCRRSKHGCYQ